MGSIERRLASLERFAQGHRDDRSKRARYLDSYFRALESFDREKAGLPPLPYTEADRRDDKEFLVETLPFYRANPGWQSEEAQHALDIWERDTREKLEKGTPQ